MKRVVSYILIISYIFICFQISYGQEINNLTYKNAKDIMIQNNTNLKLMDESIKQAEKKFKETEESSRLVGVESLKRTLNQFGLTLSPHIEMMMIKQRDFYPKQAEYNLVITKLNKIRTENTLINGLRGLYTSVVVVTNNLRVKEKKLELLKEKSRQIEVSYNKGTKSKIELNDSQFKLLETEISVKKEKRNLENAIRKINEYIGVNIDAKYYNIPYSENMYSFDLPPIEFSINKAKTYRTEAISLRRKIQLDELNLQVLAVGGINETKTEEMFEYERTKIELQSLRFQLEKVEMEVANEITNAYTDIMKEALGVNLLKNNIALQKSNIEKLKKQYKMGLISKDVVSDAEGILVELEGFLNVSILSYNSKVIKLQSATDVGPSY